MIRGIIYIVFGLGLMGIGVKGILDERKETKAIDAELVVDNEQD